MRIAQLSLYLIDVPLKREVKHASATRRSSRNLLACCRLSDGTEGWGEGVPREYVTGETAESAAAAFSQLPLSQLFVQQCHGWQDVFPLCDRLQPCRGDDPRQSHGNALRCALEISVLDAYGRLFDQPVSTVTELFEPASGVRERRDQVRYSTAMGPGC